MLGVTTLIVVNSVMNGFSTKLRDRLHGLLSDIIVEAWDNDGFANPEGKMKMILDDPLLKEHIEAMAPTLEIFAMLQFRFRTSTVTRPVHLIGIDPESRARIGGFADHLLDPNNQQKPSFELSPKAFDHWDSNHRLGAAMPLDVPRDPFKPLPTPLPLPEDGKMLAQPPVPPAPTPQSFHFPSGVILGYAIAHYRDKDPKTGEVRDQRLLDPGDEVILTTISGVRMSPVYDNFAVVDYFRSEMSEYDSNYVFVPLSSLQKMRTMENRVSSIQIRLKPNVSDTTRKELVKRLQTKFEGYPIKVETWEDKQGPLLAAISVEKGILNVLLFLIIFVAGFGILAIFSMIVMEKTRDIGILKALGASSGGVMNIFLGYGLLLGLVGMLLGTGLGLAVTYNINAIENLLASLTGQVLFDRTVYYFDKIPTDTQPLMVLLVNIGAVTIAVVSSIVPALRAALLNPVRALRYE
jgi:lipoprotein-releasing system permease protein